MFCHDEGASFEVESVLQQDRTALISAALSWSEARTVSVLLSHHAVTC